jgi:protein-tyrosine phosphatase
MLVRERQEVQALPRGLTEPGTLTSAMAGEERILDWEGALNARDTGGLPTADGGRIRHGALVRSDVISRLTPSGRQALIDHGVRTIVDVRTTDEIGRDVDYPFRTSRSDGDPSYVNASFLVELTPDGSARRESASRLGELNRIDIDLHRIGIVGIVKAVAHADEGGVLIHCHAGKDRTGMSVAMLLSLAGVSDDDIADDYALTMLNLEPLINDWLLTIEDEAERERMRELASPRREAMLETLAYVHERYGGVEQYLLDGGVTPDEIVSIRTRLVRHTDG